MTDAEVKGIIDRQAEDQLGGAQLRRELLFEVMRIRALARKSYAKAMTGDASAMPASASCNQGIRTPRDAAGVERADRACGARDPPSAGERHETSTDEIRAAVERIRGKQLPAPGNGFDPSDKPH